MPTRTPDPRPTATSTHTANDRFKRGFSSWFWAALMLATLFHAAVFIASPTFALAGTATSSTALTLERIADVPLPPEPQEIPRPATPVIATDAVADVTIPETTFDAHSSETLAPPPPGRATRCPTSSRP
jgi:hypothetical protein